MRIFQRTCHPRVSAPDDFRPRMCIATTFAQAETTEHRYSPRHRSSMLRVVDHCESDLEPCPHRMHRTYTATRSQSARLEHDVIVSTERTHHSFQCCSITCTTQIAHSPYRGPEPGDIAQSRKLNCSFYVTTREAEFVPGCHVKSHKNGGCNKDRPCRHHSYAYRCISHRPLKRIQNVPL